MGASASIINGEEMVSTNYENVRREQVWAEDYVTNSARKRRAGLRNRSSSIQDLAMHQLSNTIQSNRTVLLKSNSDVEALHKPPTCLGDTASHYSVSLPHITIPNRTRAEDILLSPIHEETSRTSRTKVHFGASPTASENDSKYVDSARSDISDEDSVRQRRPSALKKTEYVLDNMLSPTNDAKSAFVGSPVIKSRKPNLRIDAGSDTLPTTTKDHNVPKLQIGAPALANDKITKTTEAEGNEEVSLKFGNDKDGGSLLQRRKSKLLKVKSNDDEDEEDPITVSGNPSGNALYDKDNKKNDNFSQESNVRLSPGGKTVYVGDWKIKDTGLTRNTSSDMDGESCRGSDAFVEIGSLGSGASGTVVEAVHLPTLTIVALKILPVHNPKKNHHLSQELAVLYKNLADLRLVDDERLNEKKGSKSKRSARCPFVLSMYDAFVDTNSCKINLVMEFMDGGSLQDLVRNGGSRDERVLADIAYQVIKGLQFLHSQKQMHRDIKPGNILLNCKGEIKVADFGISKAMDNTFGCAKSFVGTMCYMAPERIAARNYGFPADIWSMGLTLLAVAMGEFPLPESEQGFWGLMNTICDGDPPTAGPDFSPEFNSFIAECLRKDPADRAVPAALLKHSFLDGFEPMSARSAYSDASDNSRSSSPTLDKDKSPRTLSELAASKDVSQTRRKSNDEVKEVRTEHLKHVLQTLSCRCEQRELASKLPGQKGEYDDEGDEDFLEKDELYDEEEETQKSPPKPIRLPNINGKKGAKKWRHLANQLYVSYETVLNYVDNYIPKLYFAESFNDEDDDDVNDNGNENDKGGDSDGDS